MTDKNDNENQSETRPEAEAEAKTSGKTDRKTLMVVIAFLGGLFLLIALNMN